MVVHGAALEGNRLSYAGLAVRLAPNVATTFAVLAAWVGQPVPWKTLAVARWDTLPRGAPGLVRRSILELREALAKIDAPLGVATRHAVGFALVPSRHR